MYAFKFSAESHSLTGKPAICLAIQERVFIIVIELSEVQFGQKSYAEKKMVVKKSCPLTRVSFKLRELPLDDVKCTCSQWGH